MVTATRLRLATDVDINEAAETATFTVHHQDDDDPSGYTIRVEPMTDDERETYSEPGDELTHAIRDGYSDDLYCASFDAALVVAHECYAETIAGHFNDAREGA